MEMIARFLYTGKPEMSNYGCKIVVKSDGSSYFITFHCYWVDDFTVS